MVWANQFIFNGNGDPFIFIIFFVYGMVGIACDIQFYPDSSARSRREGSGSTEATEMIVNNLFYITTKVRNDIDTEY